MLFSKSQIPSPKLQIQRGISHRYSLGKLFSGLETLDLVLWAWDLLEVLIRFHVKPHGKEGE